MVEAPHDRSTMPAENFTRDGLRGSPRHHGRSQCEVLTPNRRRGVYHRFFLQGLENRRPKHPRDGQAKFYTTCGILRLRESEAGTGFRGEQALPAGTRSGQGHQSVAHRPLRIENCLGLYLGRTAGRDDLIPHEVGAIKERPSQRQRAEKQVKSVLRTEGELIMGWCSACQRASVDDGVDASQVKGGPPDGRIDQSRC